MQIKPLVLLTALTALLVTMLLSCAINVRKFASLMPEGMKECSLCHTLDDSGMVAENGTELVDTIQEVCTACHEERVKGGEHAVGVVPRHESQLPLYDGKVECPTCHEPHGKGGNAAMLRMPPEIICSACHDNY